MPGSNAVDTAAGVRKLFAEAKRRYGIKFSFLIYDLIPIENESFVEQRHVVQFKNWLHGAISIADVVLTISKHSRDALIRLAAGAGSSATHEVTGKSAPVA